MKALQCVLCVFFIFSKNLVSMEEGRALLVRSSFLGFKEQFYVWINQQTREKKNHQLIKVSCDTDEDIERTKFLIEAGADVNCKDDCGMTPLHHAAYRNHTATVKFLLVKGADIDALSKTHETPLTLSIAGGYEKIAELLIKNGACITNSNYEGWTPLHWTTARNCRKCTLMLLERSALIDAQAHNGQTPLHLAAQSNRLEIIHSLLCYSFFFSGVNSDAFKISLNFAKQRNDSTLRELLEAIQGVACGESSAMDLHITPWKAKYIADFLPLHQQQEMLAFLDKEENETNSHCRELIISAHLARHLEEIKRVLMMRDNYGKTALDLAQKDHHPVIYLITTYELLEDFQKAKEPGDLYYRIRNLIIENIYAKINKNM